MRGHQDLKEWANKGTVEELENVDEEASSEDHLHLGRHIDTTIERPGSALARFRESLHAIHGDQAADSQCLHAKVRDVLLDKVSLALHHELGAAVGELNPVDPIVCHRVAQYYSSVRVGLRSSRVPLHWLRANPSLKVVRAGRRRKEWPVFLPFFGLLSGTMTNKHDQTNLF